MQLRLSAIGLSALVSVGVAGGSALAGPALDDDKSAGSPQPTTDPTALNGATEDAVPVEYGVGIGVRSVHVPKAILELFVDRAAGGASNIGTRVELTRRRNNLELQLGFEYEHVQVGEGVWIKKGDNVAQGDEADYVLSPDHNPNGDKLGWFTVEFTFLNHTEINKYVAIRYGGGLGIGVITGSLWHDNVICTGATNDNPEPGCVPVGSTSHDGRQGTGVLSDPPMEKYGLPPVFPVVNAIVGVQFRPIDKWTINVEGGIRTLPFFGISSSYFF